MLFRSIAPELLGEKMVQGLKATNWPGRCQIAKDATKTALTWYLDGAHTVESLQCCGDWFGAEVIARLYVFLLSVSTKANTNAGPPASSSSTAPRVATASPSSAPSPPHSLPSPTPSSTSSSAPTPPSPPAPPKAVRLPCSPLKTSLTLEQISLPKRSTWAISSNSRRSTS